MLEFQIRDEVGLVHSGTDDEMDSAWDVLTAGSEEQYIKTMQRLDCSFLAPDEIKGLKETYKKYYCKWTGDLKLVQILNIYK